jgi:uncharacterized protein YbaR (Trm112 family)
MSVSPHNLEPGHLICPGCGLQWEHTFCPHCGDRLVHHSELPRDIWKDPSVKQALKDGRQAWDIAVIRCPKCNQYGYYNEGTAFSCRFCDLTFQIVNENEHIPTDVRTISVDEIVHLDDTVTETTDGYENKTL